MTKVAAIVGPTAVGKTAAALEVARRLDAEIISIDSMQTYRGMDIGTDKATAEVRAQVPHHLLDIVDVDHELTVAEFQARARDAIAEISARAKLPLLVGGSGLYFRAVVDDLDFPPRSVEVRANLEREVRSLGAEALHARLARVDPAAAARIEPGNARRTVRALEVIEVTGRPFSDNDAWERYESRYELAVAGVSRPRDELYARIAARVDHMMSRGVIDEARALERVGMNRTARQALGYRQILEVPDDADPPTIKEAIVRATKRFARRQESWFRSDPRVRWFDAGSGSLADDLSSFFADALSLP